MPEQTAAPAQAQTPAQQELTQLLAYIRQQTEAGVEGGKALVQQQAPLVAREIVAREITLSSTGIVCGLLVAAIGATLCRKFLAKRTALRVAMGVQSLHHSYSDLGDGWGTAGIVSGVVGGVGSIILLAKNIPSLINALVAPRLVILDYIRHLM